MFAFIQLDEVTIATRLPEVLLKRRPKSSQLHNLVQYHLQEITKKVDCPAEFYWYTGLDPEHTCIAGKLFRKHHSDIQWIILAPDTQEQETMLVFAKIVNWKENMSFNSVDVTIASYIRKLCLVNQGLIISPSEGHVYDFQMEDALQLSLTEEELRLGEIELRPLTQDEAPDTLKYWKHADHNTGVAMAHTVVHIPSAGLHFNGKLVSWAFMSLDGGIHNLFTLDEYQRRGFGRILLKYLCKKLAEINLTPLVHIEAGNEVSVKTMTGIGFKYSHEMNWIVYKSPNC